MCNDDSWEDFLTCPDGFCRHWSCNSDCTRKCGQCGVHCTEHDDVDHPFVDEPETEPTT
jgi:hypothetical protein